MKILKEKKSYKHAGYSVVLVIIHGGLFTYYQGIGLHAGRPFKNLKEAYSDFHSRK